MVELLKKPSFELELKIKKEKLLMQNRISKRSIPERYRKEDKTVYFEACAR